MSSSGAAGLDGPLATIEPALEREYNLRPRHPERQAVYADFARRSQLTRSRLPALLDQRYDDGPRALLDVFPAGSGAPLFVFIHGGYWRTLDKSIFSCLAESFVDAGITVVMPNYDLAPTVPLRTIVAQMRAMLAWVAGNAARFGADPERFVLAGHSAGGHLAAMAALDCHARIDTRLSGAALRGLVPVSGLFDLRPLLSTSVNGDARLSPVEAEELSPILRMRREGVPPVPLLLLAGGAETDGFKQQSEGFLAAWRGQGGSGDLLLAPGCTHFTVLDAMAAPEGAVLAAVGAALR